MDRNSRGGSEDLRRRAERVLAGGVNSPVRAFQAVGGEPLVVDRAAGAHLYDADGREYLDYVCSWGAMILGHAHPAVTVAVQEQAARGTSYGMTNALEIELGETIAQAMPAIEMIRFVSSGTEAAMSAVRLARAFTKRDLIVKFEGGYHGHADSFLSKAGSGLATLGLAASPGVPDELARLTLNVPYNDFGAVEALFAAHPKKIAAIIIEPVAANMGVVPPREGFLRGLRELSRREGTLLIFDEVITGFRVAWGGAQERYDVTPDITVLGKIIGGGLPVAAYGGPREIMKMIAPLGPVYQAGTLSGNPLAMRAGLETLRQISGSRNFYAELERKTERLARGLANAAKENNVPVQVNAVGSLLTVFFTGRPVGNYADAKKSDTHRFARFFCEFLGRGIFLPPSQFEAWFVSAAHTDAEIDLTIEACRESMKSVAAGG